VDWTLALGALVVGVVVGLTGMGGGALMTPMLVLIFGVSPLAAVSSDLVASAVMKPVGSFVHIRNGNVRWDLVRWLCIGSVPAAFCGVLITRALGSGQNVENIVQKSLGVALIIAATGLFIRAYMRLAERAKHRDGSRAADPKGPPQLVLRPVPTVIVGVIGGVVVGMTSVGSGSLIIIALMVLYPMLRASELVGTDLAQAVPLVASAAIGHLIFGDFQLSVTGALLVGSIPGAFIGAQLSSRLPGALIRRALAFVLLASALKSLNVNTTATAIILVVIAALAGPVWMLLRRANGFPAWPRHERQLASDAPDGDAPDKPATDKPAAVDAT
jgi:uncharacterized membrane protein YfcA